MIAAGSRRTKPYCNIELPKYQTLLQELHNSGAEVGLHVSYEAGGNPLEIKKEMERMKEFCKFSVSKSRHHFLRWAEPHHIAEMEAAGITEDFTLGYADSAGFRVGTCRPYQFINPKTCTVSDVVVHPMEIMECSLDRKTYMGLDYDGAKRICVQIIDEVYKHNGELNLLWHNTSFLQEYHDRLYRELLDYIAGL